MAHFPIPSTGRRLTLAAVQSLGFSTVLFLFLLFLADNCAIGVDRADFALSPAARFQWADLAALAVLIPAFALFFVPAGWFGPGNKGRVFKRAGFSLLLAGFAVALLFGPTPNCETGQTPSETALLVLAIGLVGSGVIWGWIALARPGEARLTWDGTAEERPTRPPLGD